jgi:hypothetical protein
MTKSDTSTNPETPTKSNFVLLFVATLLGIGFAYQTNLIRDLNVKFNLLDNKLDSLIKATNINLSNYAKLSSQREVSSEPEVKVDGVVDMGEHSPHSHYLDHIPKDPNDPRQPADPDAEYSYDDFETIFHVEPLHSVVLTPKAAEILKGHDARNDEYYQDYQDIVDELSLKYKSFLDSPSLEERDRELMAIKWVSPQAGFGVFAKRDIKKGELVGIYCGEIVLNARDKDYLWSYRSKYLNGKRTRLGIDGRVKGNILRFVNHAGKNCNADAEYVIHDGIWKVVYYAVSDIRKGEEITTDYGSNYFTSRM